MIKGTVKFFNNMKNYGFIEREGEKEDVFVHKSELSPGTKIQEGSKLEFEIEEGDQGPKAVNVKKIE